MTSRESVQRSLKGSLMITRDSNCAAAAHQILIRMQQNMIAELQSLLLSASRSVNVDSTSLVNASESSRLDSISALAQQYQRFLVAAPIASGTVKAKHVRLAVESPVPARIARPYSDSAATLQDAVTVTTTKQFADPTSSSGSCSDSPSPYQPCIPSDSGPVMASLFGKYWDDGNGKLKPNFSENIWKYTDRL
ncbi:hypothetical protein EK21DRAFT_85500 [Setomelanomma holmii]|uniref:Uncharacterized protein n=1 Tax=Setomelanomma holmii TaxID=210430 RepID=A0A9P4HK52_9PLEO|nr:hypothetical protein EK21DRAFT_85500 [Setomelanomma holmii]